MCYGEAAANAQIFSQTAIEVGDLVWKHGSYTGRGTVRGISRAADGSLRYLVGHVIDGGDGEFLHVYTEKNIVKLPAAAPGRSIPRMTP